MIGPLRAHPEGYWRSSRDGEKRRLGPSNPEGFSPCPTPPSCVVAKLKQAAGAAWPPPCERGVREPTVQSAALCTWFAAEAASKSSY